MSCQISFLDNVIISNVCYAASTGSIIFKTFKSVKVVSQPCSCQFYRNSDDLKGLKTFTFEQVSQLHSLVFSKHDTNGILQKNFHFKHENINFMPGGVKKG